MRYILTMLVILGVLIVPTVTTAHGGTDTTNTDQPMMGHTTELNDETHETMEQLHEQMWAGELTDEGAQQMAELMREYHDEFMPAYGAQTGHMNYSGGGSPIGGMMMPFAGSGSWGWFAMAAQVIWLFVGILLVALLIKKLRV